MTSTDDGFCHFKKTKSIEWSLDIYLDVDGVNKKFQQPLMSEREMLKQEVLLGKTHVTKIHVQMNSTKQGFDFGNGYFDNDYDQTLFLDHILQ